MREKWFWALASVVVLLWSLSSQARTAVHVGGLTLHGFLPDNSLAEYMPNKVTQDGFLVAHPEVGVHHYTDSGWQMNLSLLRDCYNKAAVNLSYGPYYQEGNWRYGWMMHLYVREHFSATRTLQNNPAITETVQDGKYLVSARAGLYDIIVMPTLTLSQDIPLSEDKPDGWGLHWGLAGNFLINHFVVGLSF